MKSNLAPLAVAVCAMAVVAGTALYIVNSPGRNVTDREPAAQGGSPGDVQVYTPSYTRQGDLKLSPSTARPTPEQDPHVFAVNQYLAQLKMVPKGAVAKTCTVSNGVATLDFSTEFDTTYGTEDEQTVLKGLLKTMAQFSDVKKVKFTVEGRTLASLGNIDLTEPQDVNFEASESGPDEGAPTPPPTSQGQ